MVKFFAREVVLEKKAIVIHSGGMDSTLCLHQAIADHGKGAVLSLGFSYGQRHSNELEVAAMICQEWGVERVVVNINCLQEITQNSLLNHDMSIEHIDGKSPNSLVTGRNGLMVRLAAIHGEKWGVNEVYTGVIEVEEANSGYRDCSRDYMDLMEKILQLDLDNPNFKVKTPIVKMTKLETMELAYEWGILTFALENTITCYEGIPQEGCQKCPACFLRNEGIIQFKEKYPHFILSFLHRLKKL